MKKHKLRTLIVSALFFCLSYSVVYAENMELIYDGERHLVDVLPISLYIDGEPIETTVMPPISLDSHILVPAGEICRHLGIVVEWKGKEQSIYIDNGETLIVLQINSLEAWVNGEIIFLDVPAKLINDKVMVPLRFMSEVMGYSVLWNQQDKSITIISPVKVPTVLPELENPQLPDENSTVLPEAPLPIVNYDWILPENLQYIQDTNTLQLNSLGRFNMNQINIEDRYVDRQLIIDLQADYSDIYPSGAWVNGQGILKSLEVVNDGTTKLVLTTSKVQALQTYEYDNRIYLQCVNARDKYSKIVVLDPGHGDQDKGASYQGILEKDLNLSLGKTLFDILEGDPNIKVYTTRNEDTFMELYERPQFANEIAPDLFISIHINSVDNNSKANGTETYYTIKEDGRNKRFAQMVHKELLSAFGTTNRGVKAAKFVVTKETEAPAILTEIGFLTNEKDREMMLQDDFSTKYAQAVYNAILAYYYEGLESQIIFNEEALPGSNTKMEEGNGGEAIDATFPFDTTTEEIEDIMPLH